MASGVWVVGPVALGYVSAEPRLAVELQAEVVETAPMFFLALYGLGCLSFLSPL